MKTDICNILKKDKARENTDDQLHLKRTLDTVTIVTVNVKEDLRVIVGDLGAANKVSSGRINNILLDELGLVKKSVSFVPKLLRDGKKLRES
jgi:hypothetical protein